MSHAEKCPVCLGVGQVEQLNPYNCSSVSSGRIKYIKPCHGCNGTGWVTVQDENVSELKLVNNKS